MGIAGHEVRHSNRYRMIAAERLFFPAAALYGALVVPLSVHGMLTGHPLLPGFGTIAGHAHELLFGFAMAVVIGFLINKIGRYHLALLFGFWLGGRMLYLGFPDSPATLAIHLALGALLAATVTPKLIKGAKKWRNRVFGPLIVAIVLVPGAFHLAQASDSMALEYLMLRESVVLFSLLMLFMGGRIIAPAVAGAIERAGSTLEARVQPRIEGALLALPLIAVFGLALPGGRVPTGIALIATGILAAVRLLRWRLWRCRDRPDLLCLGIGYAWLAVGLGLLGSAWAFGMPTLGAATHAITVGALGTLSTSVMLRVRLLRAKQDIARTRSLPVITGLMGLAAVSRIGWPTDPGALWLAAGCWSLALLVALWRMGR